MHIRDNLRYWQLVAAFGWVLAIGGVLLGFALCKRPQCLTVSEVVRIQPRLQAFLSDQQKSDLYCWTKIQ